ncbi:MAG TPA: nucleotidyltransferase family protein, partial [Caldilineae bacterium]|nr:nucleotidyltransferase family protein [Caldilineae bacterium]
MSPLPPALTSPTDPAAFPAWLAWLDANRLTPLAARRLADTKLPVDVRSHLSVAYIQARAQWLQRQYETVALLDILAQTPSIPSVLLKGIALAVSLYPDPALRPMNDVDFLVPVDSLSKLSERMKSCGYIEEGHTPGLDVTKLYQMCFISTRTASSLKLEFHATFTHLKPTYENGAMHWFWSQTEDFDFFGHSVRGLNPTSQLLYLAAHSMQQHGQASAPLIWIHDIDLLIRNRGDDISWSEIFDVAHEFGWEASLYSACELAQSSFATPLPSPLHEWL